jgi:hypothetical protein
MQARGQEQEQDAYRELENGRRDDIPENVFLMVRAEAYRTYPRNFTQAALHAREQYRAYRVLQRRSPKGVPDYAFKLIREDAARAHPRDFASRAREEAELIRAHRRNQK